MSTVVIVLTAVGALAAVAFLLVRSLMSPMAVIRPSVVRSVPRFLGQAHNDAEQIYGPNERFEPGSLVIPFGDLVVDALEAMTVIHFADSDRGEYIGLEPQVYRLPEGKSHLRLLATTTKRTEGDIYLPRGTLDQDERCARCTEPLGQVRDVVETDFEKFELSITDKGLLVDVDFVDQLGHRHQLFVDEQRLGKNVPFRSMVAPATLATHTAYFPFIFLDSMAIASKRSEVSVRVDGKEKALHKVPVLGGDLIIYSRNALAFYLFLASDAAPLEVHHPRAEATTIERQSPNYEASRAHLFSPEDKVRGIFHIQRNSGLVEISSAEWVSRENHLNLELMPALPDLLHLRQGAEVRGRFAISVNRTPGVLTGTYRVERTGHQALIELQPKDVYQPVTGDTWVRAYRWRGTIDLEGAQPTLESRWHKKTIVNDGLHVSIADE